MKTALNTLVLTTTCRSCSLMFREVTLSFDLYPLFLLSGIPLDLMGLMDMMSLLWMESMLEDNSSPNDWKGKDAVISDV